ncbi:sensor histidine kinase [Streptomyces sp. AJS327]|uniref:sensor histidine kinase n=1 Tax=Streptomyces sp. AJS327 TaxID=2545265 RepID=UPI0015DECA12|nr:histidine kinase [Streptomyces sp. AJS327]
MKKARRGRTAAEPTGRLTGRQRVVDVLAVLGAALFAWMMAADEFDRGQVSLAYGATSLALTSAGCLALWWRRRHPVGVAVAVLPGVAVTDIVGLAVLVSLFTVAANRSWRTTCWVWLVHAVATAPLGAVRPDPDFAALELNALGSALLFVLLSLVIPVPVLYWGVRVRRRRELIGGLRTAVVQAEQASERDAEQHRALERQRIAREMHDSLAHRLSLVSVHAGALELRADMPREEVEYVAHTIRTSAHEALEELRDILGVLRNDGGERTRTVPQPGVEALERLVEEARSAGTPVVLDDRAPREVPVPPAVSRAVYRVVQEGLTNARKHAPRQSVSVSLHPAGDGELLVSLSNPVPGAEGSQPASRQRPKDVRTGHVQGVVGGKPDGAASTVPAAGGVPGSGAGLTGLVERVRLVGGTADHGMHRDPSGGVVFRVDVRLPWSS